MFQALCRYIHVAITNQSLKVKVEIKILFPNLQKTSSKEGNFIAETPYSFHKLVDNNYTYASWHVSPHYHISICAYCPFDIQSD
jgi:hypothetical protein